MKIVFIDASESTINFGIRTLAAYLDAHGFDTSIIFLPVRKINNSYNFPETVYNDLTLLINDADIIGLSVLSNYVGQAKFLTEFIHKNFNKLVIWGGIHAMAKPEECLDYADIVCLGEAEEALLELLRKMESGINYYDTNNFWFNINGKIIKNGVCPLEKNLDKYPYPFYQQNKIYLLENNRVVLISDSQVKKLSEVSGVFFGDKRKLYHSYLTLTSRGCPFHCSYCCNSLYNNLYNGKNKILRHRSNEHVIGELLSILKKYPFIDLIEFFDDDFLSSSLTNIKEFAELFKSRINLPFRINITPYSLSEEKIKILADAGLISVEMGLQTASTRINKDIYNRKFHHDKFLKAANILHKYENIRINYDLIFDNPYENYKDISDTFRFIDKLPVPYKLNMFSLTFYPGSELYYKAKEQGILADENFEIYDKRDNKLYEAKDSYIKFLLFVFRAKNRFKLNMTFLFIFLSSPAAIKIFNSPTFNWFFKYFLKIKTKDQV